MEIEGKVVNWANHQSQEQILTINCKSSSRSDFLPLSSSILHWICQLFSPGTPLDSIFSFFSPSSHAIEFWYHMLYTHAARPWAVDNCARINSTSVKVHSPYWRSSSFFLFVHITFLFAFVRYEDELDLTFTENWNKAAVKISVQRSNL